ncbi:MAG TPA: LLM class flavin-dependent oxidoreductase [Bacteroidia bacterium]|nr:LLM class flavin-dependent oxidoreductase [Bacteroidia bacterium]
MPEKNLKLSILDQSVIRKGGNASQAIKETIELVKLAEQLGYYRFWVSEHHNSTMIAGSTPELLMVKLATETNTIRIGSGGIMLSNHSALKMAENFRMLETLFPGRIDMGIGRAPGGDRVTAALLNPSNTFSENSYLSQLEQLNAFFHDEASTGYGRILAVPQSNTIPQQWMLSSSAGGSSRIAAKLGMGLAVARFINGHADPEMVKQYHSQFEPCDELKKPTAILAISVICAPTEEKASSLRKLIDYTLLKFEQGIFEPMGSAEEIADYHFSPQELIRIDHNKGRIVSGTPSSVKSQLINLAQEFDVDEIVITTMTYSKQDRFESFRLIAEAFELTANTALTKLN